jgi:hypothetical protein
MDNEVPASHHPTAVVLGVLVAAAFLILVGIFITATLVICKRRSATSQLQQEEMDAFKLRQEQHPNVYSEPAAPLDPATVFSVPSYVPHGCCTDSVPRVRFRTDPVDLQDRSSVYLAGGEESLALNKRKSNPTNGKLKLLHINTAECVAV